MGMKRVKIADRSGKCSECGGEIKEGVDHVVNNWPGMIHVECI